MREFITDFFNAQDYPRDAAASLLEAYDKMMENGAMKALFDKYLSEYEAFDRTNFGEFCVLVSRCADDAGVHTYAAELLCFICAAKHLRVMYEKAGIPLEVYSASVCDLRYKLMECKKLHGVWGSFVCSWFCQFFTLERFQIGRLQYELNTHFATEEPYHTCGIELEKGKTPVINLHIPSCGPLTEDAVTDSLRKAFKFFEKYFPGHLCDGKMIIECGSWLLFKDHEKFLPEGSNILRFQRKFELTSSWYDENFSDCWRIFNKNWDGDAASLPRDTALQRAYADRLEAGNPAGGGNGIIVFDGKNIINK